MKVFKTPRILFRLYPRRTWGFSLHENAVYLTFDDGPTPQLTDWIIELLAKEGIPATFFCVGENIKGLPESFEKIKSSGHQVGSHTMRHQNSSSTSWKTYKASVEACGTLVGNKLFRPPYGRLSAWKSFLLAGNYKIVMWSWLSYDYDHKVAVEDILQSAKKDIQAGDILVLHDNEKVEERLKVILPELIQIVREKGLEFKLISA